MLRLEKWMDIMSASNKDNDIASLRGFALLQLPQFWVSCNILCP